MIKEIIEKKLPLISKKISEAQFGKRNFIGASDVVKCERQFLLSKIKPIEFDTKTLIRFFRGHIAEILLREVFNETNYLWEEQYVAQSDDKIRATLDFVFYTKRWDKIRVVENKTVSGIPEFPYENWIQQIMFQMGIMQQRYPNADIKGCIFVLDMNSGEYTEFEVLPNKQIFNCLLEKAERLLKLWEERNIEEARCETSMLCGYCEYRSDCPKFNSGQNIVPEELKSMAQRYLELSAEKKQIEDKLETIKKEILNYCGESFNGSSEGITIKVSKTKDTTIVDSNKLKEEYPDIYKNVSKVKSGYLRLEIK